VGDQPKGYRWIRHRSGARTLSAWGGKPAEAAAHRLAIAAVASMSGIEVVRDLGANIQIIHVSARQRARP